MRIVKSEYGYAIEKGWVFKRYRSLRTDAWWSLGYGTREECIEYCWNKSLSVVTDLFYRIQGRLRKPKIVGVSKVECLLED